MSCTKSSILLSMKHPRRIDKVIDTVPNLKEAHLNFGLPKWKTMPLYNKIPVFPSPDKAYKFSRQKLGQTLRLTIPDMKFNLDDPYNRELDGSYNALHDKHLTNFFSRSNNKKHLVKMGLVSSKMEVICTPKEYNDQRMYWSKVYGEMVQHALHTRDNLTREKKILQSSEDMAKKEVKKLQEYERRRQAADIQKLNEQNRLQNFIDKLNKKQQYHNQFMLMKKIDFMLRLSNGEARMMHVQQTLDKEKRIEKCRLLTFCQKRRKKEHKRIKERNKRLTDIKNNKINMINDRWKKKEALQNYAIDKEQNITLCTQMQRKENIDKYNKKVTKQRDLNEKRLEIRKIINKHKRKNKKNNAMLFPIAKQTKQTKQTKSITHKARKKKESTPQPQYKLKVDRPRKSEKKPKAKKPTEPKILQLFSLVKDAIDEKKCACYDSERCGSLSQKN